MTDKELIARLRLPWPKDGSGDEVTLPLWVLILTAEAADRIEALTAKVKLMDDLDVINGEKIEVLTAKLAGAEAKLAKAVEAKQLASDAGPCVCFACLEARALLAEIEGTDAP